MQPGVRVFRKVGAQHDGDLPDWVGWDRDRGMWAVCEAKGSYGSTRWMNGEPEPVTTALRQIDRIEFRDAAGPIASEGWVVASRWGTVDNGRQPVVMTVDPRNDGRVLSPDEARRAEGELRVEYASLLSAVGQEPIAERLRSGATPTADDDRGLVRVGDKVGYAALAIDGAGLFPMAGDEREDLRRALLRFARDRGRKTALIVIDRNCVEVARSREIDDAQATLEFDQADLPSLNETAMTEDASADGVDSPVITQDGLTLTWEPDRLDLTAV